MKIDQSTVSSVYAQNNVNISSSQVASSTNLPKSNSDTVQLSPEALNALAAENEILSTDGEFTQSSPTLGDGTYTPNSSGGTTLPPLPPKQGN